MVDALGEGVESLSPGDAVAMEPGVPCGACRECRIGRYNLCKDVRFWATPPHDGVLAEYVIHPAALTFRLPGHMTSEEGALMEPLAVGVHACERGGVGPGCVVAIAGRRHAAEHRRPGRQHPDHAGAYMVRRLASRSRRSFMARRSRICSQRDDAGWATSRGGDLQALRMSRCR